MRRLVGTIWLTLLVAASVAAQSQHTRSLGAGKLLVASRDLGDPNFAETVVLLVHYDDEGVLGLIINKRSKIPISRALEDLKSAKGRSDTLYLGGPVGRTGILGLLRSRTKVEEGERVFGDVYLVSSATSVEKTLASGATADQFHVYAGYAGWTAEQLEGEVELGAWYIFSGDAAEVFASRPESVWERLIQKTENQVALAGSRCGPCGVVPNRLR
jgi:putative transcriptional regulator